MSRSFLGKSGAGDKILYYGNAGSINQTNPKEIDFYGLKSLRAMLPLEVNAAKKAMRKVALNHNLPLMILLAGGSIIAGLLSSMWSTRPDNAGISMLSNPEANIASILAMILSLLCVIMSAWQGARLVAAFRPIHICKETKSRVQNSVAEIDALLQTYEHKRNGKGAPKPLGLLIAEARYFYIAKLLRSRDVYEPELSALEKAISETRVRASEHLLKGDKETKINANKEHY